MLINVWQCIPHLEWNVVFHQPFHEESRLHAGAVEHGNIRQAVAHLHIILDFFYDRPGLGRGIRESDRRDWSSSSPCCADFFLETGFIVADQTAGVIHNIGSRAVVYPQKNAFCLGIVLLKPEHDLRLRTAEAVNGLVIITHDKQVILRCCQHPDNLILHPVDVLELIDQDILVLSLPCLQNVFSLGKQLIAEHQHIIKIQKAFLDHGFFIALVQLLEHFF